MSSPFSEKQQLLLDLLKSLTPEQQVQHLKTVDAGFLQNLVVLMKKVRERSEAGIVAVLNGSIPARDNLTPYFTTFHLPRIEDSIRKVIPTNHEAAMCSELECTNLICADGIVCMRCINYPNHIDNIDWGCSCLCSTCNQRTAHPIDTCTATAASPL
jgi:hypothetical protein